MSRLLLAWSVPTLLSLICCLPGADDESGSSDSTEARGAPSIQVRQVQFGRGIDAQYNLVGGPVQEFRADETSVHVRAVIAGRPRAGTIHIAWRWRDEPIADTDIDLSDVNGGMLFSFGQDTIVRVHLTAQMLYIGPGNRVILSVDGQELGTYPFSVVPPADATPSRLNEAQLFRAFSEEAGPSDPTSTFATTDTITLAGNAQMGRLSWMDVSWTVNGQPMPELTRSVVAQRNVERLPFYFQAVPPGTGWPVGTHTAALRLDGQDVGTHAITIVPAVTP